MDIIVWKNGNKNTTNILLEFVGIIDSFNSLIWTERYSEHGDFELYLPYDEYIGSLLVKGNFLSINDSDQFMLIEAINQKTENGVPQYIIQGRTMTALLSRRMHYGTTKFNDPELAITGTEFFMNKSVYDIVKFLVDFNITKAYDYSREFGPWTENTTNNVNIRKYLTDQAEKRQISNYITKPFEEDDDPYGILTGKKPKNFGIENQTVYDVIKALTDRYHFGFKMRYFNNAFYLCLYNGIFRDGSANAGNIIFSPDLDNVSDINFVDTDVDNYNVVIGKGSYDSGDDTIQHYTAICSNGNKLSDTSKVGDLPFKGLDLIETFTDLSDVQYETTDIYGNVISNTDESYHRRIDNKALDVLNKNKKNTYNFEATVNDPDYYKLREEYDLGDVVNVQYNGMVNKVRVSEIIHSYNSEGYKIYPTFTLYEEIEEEEL